MNQSPSNPYNVDLPYFPCTPLTTEQIKQAPVVFVSSTELDCTPDQLFEVFDDPEAWTRWTVGIQRVVWTSPRPFGIGTTRTVYFVDHTEVYEVFHAWDHGKEMSFHFVGHSQLIWNAFGEHYEVIDLGGGRCKLLWTVGYDPAGTFGRIHWMIRPALRLNFTLYMRWLRAYVRRRFT